MKTRPDQEQLWGTDQDRIYWWHVPVRPERSASLGRDMLFILIGWIAGLAVLLVVADYLLAVTA